MKVTDSDILGQEDWQYSVQRTYNASKIKDHMLQ